MKTIKELEVIQASPKYFMRDRMMVFHQIAILKNVVELIDEFKDNVPVDVSKIRWEYTWKQLKARIKG